MADTANPTTTSTTATPTPTHKHLPYTHAELNDRLLTGSLDMHRFGATLHAIMPTINAAVNWINAEITSRQPAVPGTAEMTTTTTAAKPKKG